MKQKKIWLSLLLTLFVFLLSGCAEDGTPDENSIPVYFVNTKETKIEIHDISIPEMGEGTSKVQTLLDVLGVTPAKLEYKAPLAMGFRLEDYLYEDGWLTLDFSEEYLDMKPTTEVLVRAAIVQTLVQIPEVKYVSFTVKGERLLDAAMQNVGWMNDATFIYNNGNDINTYEEVRVKLYFATDDGTRLIGAYREKFYSTSVPLERFIVDELISGPSGQISELHPTITAETKVLSVSTKDRVCYVNFDNSFLVPANNVSTEMAIYSIVNSLTELSYIDKVQVMVNGDTPATFPAPTFERSNDVVITLEQAREQAEGSSDEAGVEKEVITE